MSPDGLIGPDSTDGQVSPDGPTSPVTADGLVTTDGSVGSLHSDVLAVLEGWNPPDDDQAALRSAYVEHLRQHPGDGELLTCGPTHLTASGIILDPTGDRVLLTLHRKGNFWVQTGGHIETGDASLSAAALREASEESGIPGLRLVSDAPVDLDRHTLPSAFGGCREHLDVRFAVVAPAGGVPVVSDESHDVAWFEADALPPEAVVDLDRLVAAARSALLAPAQDTGSSSDRSSPAVAETPSR